MILPRYRLSARPLWIALALIAATAALASLALTPWLNLEPCHLCIFQRLLFLLMALFAILAALLTTTTARARWRSIAARASALAFLALATLGGGVAAYQSWLQWQPMDSVSCIGGSPGPIERLVEWLGQQLPALFLASGFCEEKQLTILGLSLANWAFLVFAASLAVGAWAIARGWGSKN